MKAGGHIALVHKCAQCGMHYFTCTCGEVQACCSSRLERRGRFEALGDAVVHAQTHVRNDDTIIADVPEVPR